MFKEKEDDFSKDLIIIVKFSVVSFFVILVMFIKY